MNQSVTGTMIKRLRQEKNMTQTQLAKQLNISDKTVSKWETGHGCPDTALIEPLAAALGVSVIELFAGQNVINTNKVSHLMKLKFYVCPLCGNIIQSIGEAVISCCGIALMPLKASSVNNQHTCHISRVEDEYYISIAHEMSKTHYIPFIAATGDDKYEIKKLYPEGAAEARFKISATQQIYYYCNQHGLFQITAK